MDVQVAAPKLAIVGNQWLHSSLRFIDALVSACSAVSQNRHSFSTELGVCVTFVCGLFMDVFSLYMCVLLLTRGIIHAFCLY